MEADPKFSLRSEETYYIELFFVLNDLFFMKQLK